MLIVENSRSDFYLSKNLILNKMVKGKLSEPDCVFCHKPVHSKAFIMKCEHAACFVCAKDYFKDAKDFSCPGCSDYQNLYWRIQSCLAEPINLNFKEHAEVDISNHRLLRGKKLKKRKSRLQETNWTNLLDSMMCQMTS